MRGKIIGPFLLFFLLLLLISGVCPAEELREDLYFAFVQYPVREENYRSESIFFRNVEKIVTEAVKNGAEVLIFPEYSSVFLATIPLAEDLSSIRSLGEGLALLQSHYGRQVGLKEFFLLRSGEVRRIMNRVWGGLAQSHGIWIGAGTALVAGPGDTLRNRFFLYGPDGRLRYTQDKVYLTPFEKEVLRLDPGSFSATRVVGIENLELGFTICRDTFFEEWEKRFGDVDLWVDLKANGEEFDEETEKIFLEALPERIRRTNARYGATVCLTGSFLELFWEGESSVIRAVENPEGYIKIVSTDTPVGKKILYAKITDGS